MSNEVMFKRGEAVSEVPFIPLGKQVLIKGVGVTKEMSLMTDEASAKVALTLYIAGLGNDEDCQVGVVIGDRVSLASIEPFAFKHLELDGNDKSVVNRIVQLGKEHKLSGLAKNVARDKAKSKIALNHSSIIDPNTMGELNADSIKGTKVVNLSGKEVLFGQKDVDIVEYYTTSVHNIDGVYAEIPKETK